MKRLKNLISEKIYKDLLKKIDRANKDLREATHHNIALEPLRRKRRSKCPIADIKHIRRIAASLYQVIMNDKTWKCKCKMHHLASLRLEARPQTIKDVTATKRRKHAFRILLSVADGTDSKSATANLGRYRDHPVPPISSA